MRTAAAPPQPLLARITGAITAMVMPGLMLVAAILARRNVKLGRGDRRGALVAATAVFALLIGAWLLGNNRVGPLSIEIDRLFAAIGAALFSAAVVWLSYLGIEPYIRRFSADALIGWSRLIAGNWRDPRVGRDVMIGVAVGIAMTMAYGVHNLLPPLLGSPEPQPATPDPTVLLSVRYAMARILLQTQDAMTSAMLGLGGFVALRIWLKNRWLAAIAAIVCYAGGVMNGMFSAGAPMADLVIGVIITSAFVAVIGWAGLLTSIAALTTHFILLRAPLTTDFSSWRATPGLVFLGAVLALGLGACYVASQGTRNLTGRG
jgi:serine/threonine-protein kinase